MLDFLIQPPTQLTAGCVMFPPPLLRIVSEPGLYEDPSQMFVHLTILDSNGNPTDNVPQGNKDASLRPLPRSADHVINGHDTRAQSYIYFHNLAFLNHGDCKLRFTLMRMNNENQQVEFIEHIDSRVVNITPVTMEYHRPSK